MEKKRILLLVDGDMVAFSHAAAEEYGKEPEEISFAKIQMSMDSKMEFMSKRLNATDTVCVISGDENMRHTINPTYKANRDGVWRPDNLKNAKACLMTNWDGVKMEGLEADDLIAMLARFDYEMVMGKKGVIKELIYKGPNTYDEVIIASLDKDLAQIGKSGAIGPVIKHYRWETKTTGEKLTVVSGFGELKCIIKTDSKGNKKKEIKGNGAKFFLWQLLTGDPTDGIIGCGITVQKMRKSGKNIGQMYDAREGVGAVAAFELLDKIDNYVEGLSVVATQYVMRFGDGWKEELLINGRLLYMANMVDEGHKVRMWHYDGKTVDHFDLKTKQLISASA
ncbi:TPA: hypothetical protein SIF59_004275 [Escherichia coli]|nr:hypothetical protein [Escherichia coli]